MVPKIEFDLLILFDDIGWAIGEFRFFQAVERIENFISSLKEDEKIFCLSNLIDRYKTFLEETYHFSDLLGEEQLVDPSIKYLIEWMKNKKTEINFSTTQTRKKKKDETESAPQFLILYYLGVIHNINRTNVNKTIIADLLAILLNRNSQTIREILTYFQTKKPLDIFNNTNHLTTVKNIFEELGFSRLANSVQKDIESLSNN